MPRLIPTSFSGIRFSKSVLAGQLSLLAAVTLGLCGGGASAQSLNVPTQVVLSVTSNGVPAGTVASGVPVTLSAVAMTNGVPVTSGIIQFCDTTGPYCLVGQSLGLINIPATGATEVTYIPAAGSHDYVAYLLSSSSANQTASSTSPLTVTPPSVQVPASDFSIAMFPGTSASQTLPAGTEQTAFNFVVSPVGGTTIPAINVTTSGLEESVSATLTPQAMAAGSAAVSAQMGLSWGNVATLQGSERIQRELAPIAMGLLLLPFAAWKRRSRSKVCRLLCVLLLSVAGIGAMSGLTGCVTAKSAGFHNATITATSGSVSHSLTVSYWNGF
jgi:hypothetical protein